MLVQMNSLVPFANTASIIGQNGFSSFVKQPVSEKENSEIKEAVLRLKFDLVSPPVRSSRVEEINILQYQQFRHDGLWWIPPNLVKKRVS